MRILLAHNQRQTRSALRRILEQDSEFNVVGEASEVEGLLAQTQIAHPDLVLLHWELPGSQGTDVLPALHCLSHHPRVLAFSEHRGARQEAIAAGVDAFVSKNEPVERLLNTVRVIGGLSPYYLG